MTCVLSDGQACSYVVFHYLRHCCCDKKAFGMLLLGNPRAWQGAIKSRVTARDGFYYNRTQVE